MLVSGVEQVCMGAAMVKVLSCCVGSCAWGWIQCQAPGVADTGSS